MMLAALEIEGNNALCNTDSSLCTGGRETSGSFQTHLRTHADQTRPNPLVPSLQGGHRDMPMMLAPLALIMAVVFGTYATDKLRGGR